MKQSSEHWSEIINSDSIENPLININNDLKELNGMAHITVDTNKRKTVFSTEN